MAAWSLPTVAIFLSARTSLSGESAAYLLPLSWRNRFEISLGFQHESF
jgi:hypothetical protein